MKERALVILSLVLIVVALVGLNAASYTRVEKTPDSELRANRSTFNGGSTGTRAFYDFLRESGKPVTRWQEKPDALLKSSNAAVKTFVVVGKLRVPFEPNEVDDLLEWVGRGGRLVLIDREPAAQLLPTAGNFKVSSKTDASLDPANVDPSNVNGMTNSVTALKPTQPTLLTKMVNSVLPSRFAADIVLEPTAFETIVIEPPSSRTNNENPSPAMVDDDAGDEDETPVIVDEELDDADAAEQSSAAVKTINAVPGAPVVHLANKDRALLVDYAYGNGRIMFLGDPYVVSNGGIELVDNLRLAINLVDNNGLTAFDEYHQGNGAAGNPILNRFAGTPVPAIAAQFALIVVLLVLSRGKRFARPLPLPNPDRRSKLEYVAAMAELLRRTKSYDLAIENIYTETRRHLARYAGVDNTTATRDALAAKIAERSKLNKTELENLMRECEDVIHGERVNDKKALALVRRLRETEAALGLRKSKTI